MTFICDCRALKYKPLSLTDDDLPTPGCTDLMNDPMIQSFLTKSHSTANIHQTHSLNSTPPSSSVSITSTPPSNSVSSHITSTYLWQAILLILVNVMELNHYAQNKWIFPITCSLRNSEYILLYIVIVKYWHRYTTTVNSE